MALYLVQHGKSLPRDQDPEKGLSEKGKEEVARIGRSAAANGLRVAVVRHSGKKRARQTAEILADLLRPEAGVEEASGLLPLDDVVPVAASLKPSDNMMLVGHLPFLADLVSYLVTGSKGPAVVSFQNGGIVCLDRNADDPGWSVRWALMPDMR